MNRDWWCSISLCSTRIMAALSSKFRALASFSPGFSFCRMLGPKTVARFDAVILFPGIYKRKHKGNLWAVGAVEWGVPGFPHPPQGRNTREG